MSTTDSQLRHDLAEGLANSCPPEFGTEILLTGSTARGQADEHSDIEINFFVDELPAHEQRDRWLQEIGATQLRGKSSEHGVKFLYQSIWFEAMWEAIPAFDILVEHLAAGEITAHDTLVLADILHKALPLRTVGHLARWQESLREYPELLSKKLITPAAKFWLPPHSILGHLDRRDYLILNQRMQNEVKQNLRILFALNRQWEPFWKWMHTLCAGLTIKPEQLAERIDQIFLAPQLVAVRTCLELTRDTLALIADDYDVAEVQAIIEQQLQGVRQRESL